MGHKEILWATYHSVIWIVEFSSEISYVGVKFYRDFWGVNARTSPLRRMERPLKKYEGWHETSYPEKLSQSLLTPPCLPSVSHLSTDPRSRKGWRWDLPNVSPSELNQSFPTPRTNVCPGKGPPFSRVYRCTGCGDRKYPGLLSRGFLALLTLKTGSPKIKMNTTKRKGPNDGSYGKRSGKHPSSILDGQIKTFDEFPKS